MNIASNDVTIWEHGIVIGVYGGEREECESVETRSKIHVLVFAKNLGSGQGFSKYG